MVGSANLRLSAWQDTDVRIGSFRAVIGCVGVRHAVAGRAENFQRCCRYERLQWIDRLGHPQHGFNDIARFRSVDCFIDLFKRIERDQFIEGKAALHMQVDKLRYEHGRHGFALDDSMQTASSRHYMRDVQRNFRACRRCTHESANAL